MGGEGFDDMEPEELDALGTLHTEEEEAGSYEDEEVLRSNLMVKFLGEMLQDVQLLRDCEMLIRSWSTTSNSREGWMTGCSHTRSYIETCGNLPGNS